MEAVMMTMNQYGAQAKTHWQTHRAAEYAELTDPTAFFTDLGNRIAAEVSRRRDEMEKTTGAGQSDSFLANLGSLNETQTSVTGEVMREMAFTEPGGPM
jgi:hypothetical protein